MKKDFIMLAFDTTISSGSISLFNENREVDSALGDTDYARSEDSFENISSLLEKNNLKVADLDCVAVAIGPGSYTGIRVGISTAQGIAASVGCQTVGVSSFEVLAALIGNPCLVGIWAGRNEVAAQQFTSSRSVELPQIMSLESFSESAREMNVDMVLDRRAFDAAKKENISMNGVIVSDKVSRCVGEVAKKILARGKPSDLRPIYAREFLIG